MKVDRQKVVLAALALLDDVGLEQLTLRRLATELKIQAPTLYWHFKSKEELIDEMATTLLTIDPASLMPTRKSSPWRIWAATFGHGLRKILLSYRDGARMVAGTRLTNALFIEITETIGAHLREEGFTIRETVVLLSTVYSYTISFTTEEQAVYPKPGEREPKYDLKKRQALFDPKKFPIHSQSGPILFDHFDRRFKEGLDLILRGADTHAHDTPSAKPTKRSRSPDRR
ncbi:TetR/AcrR family transcriptional regulator C-terminal domain-containing protein [Granulicella sp. L60]|uniref:TetR/AcrR family transcriptional regulator C-terminal domain-containing protein n=1 Tax=Granulicella sp. L60 TaxID=1641866 RepID=UPI00131BDA2A|nr:TetR/AcrR family transcriptional regulator C-terminal domain-containing protein [Granulicella sp. L60]